MIPLNVCLFMVPASTFVSECSCFLWEHTATQQNTAARDHHLLLNVSKTSAMVKEQAELEGQQMGCILEEDELLQLCWRSSFTQLWWSLWTSLWSAAASEPGQQHWLNWWGRLRGWRSLISILDHPDLSLHHLLSRPHTEWCHQTGYSPSDREKEVFHDTFLSGNWRSLAVTKRNLVKQKGCHWKRPSDCFAWMLQTPVVCTEDANFSSGCKKL